MRQPHVRLPLLLILLLYVTLLILGQFVLISFRIKWTRNRAEEELDEILDDYQEGRAPTLHYTNTAFFLLTPDGDVVTSLMYPNLLIHVDTLSLAMRDLPTVRAGRATSTVALFGHPTTAPWESYPEESRISGIQVILGRPIWTSNALPPGTRGPACVFFICNLPTLTLTSVSYTVGLTCVALLVLFGYFLMLRQNRRLNALREEYLANISHDLKTPIASARALVETLSDGMVEDEETRAAYFGIVLNELNRLHYMVTGIIKMSRIQTGATDFNKSTVTVREAIGETLENYRVFCEDFYRSFDVTFDIDDLPPLYTNAACLTQVLANLLDNAVKFTGEEGHITVSVHRSRFRLTFCVQDDGIGIDEVHHPHIFERFYQAAPTMDGPGSGLGLPIARALLDGLGERIWFESKVGEGSAFYFTAAVSRKS